MPAAPSPTDPQVVAPPIPMVGGVPLAVAEAISFYLQTCFKPYQRRWILDEADIALMLKGRQIGITDASAMRGVIRAFILKRPQTYISASEKVAFEAIEQARRHCETLAHLGVPGIMEFENDSAHQLVWASGGSMTAISANQRTARGYHGDVTLDEFAYHGDPEGMKDAAAAIATRGDYQLRVLSTPNGAIGLFYEWAHELELARAEGRRSALVVVPEGFKEEDCPDWSFHRVTLDDAIAEGLQVNLPKLWSLVGGDERVFDQVYRCKWLSADFQYLPNEWIERAYGHRDELPDLAGSGIDWYAGLDVGREHDLTVLTVIAVVKGIAWVVAILTCRRERYKLQKEMIKTARKVFPWQKLIIDKTGLGSQLAEELVHGDDSGFDGFGEDEAIPVSFTAELKEDLATRGLRWLRDDALRLCQDEEGKKLRDEMRAMRRIITKAGNVTYDVPRNQLGHCDRLFSLLLALRGAGEPRVHRGMGQDPLFAIP